MSQAEQYKQIARRWYDEVFAGGNLEIADTVFHPDFLSHDPGPTGAGWPRGPQGPREVVTLWKSAFPDASFVIEDQVVDGDMVATRWSATGTQAGLLLDMPASGRLIQVTGIDIFRMQGDKVVEQWVIYDLLGILIQIGALPTPEAAAV